MSSSNLEERVDALEREVRLLKSAIGAGVSPQPPWWERLAGTFKDDPLFDKIVEEGRKYRKSQTPRRR